jgi:hypothetical protein
VTGVVDSADLAAMLTSPKFTDRILGGNTSMRAKPMCRWIITGNQLLLSTDNRRRFYTIMLDPKRSDPQNRTFRHPDLEQWITANRPNLVKALLILIRNWFAKGCPPSSAVPPMSNFTPWATLVGGILEAAGINGFLLNLDEAYTSDLESEEWESFLLSISEVTYGAEFTVSELNDILREQTWDEGRHKAEPSNNAKKLRGAMPGSLQVSLNRPESLPHAVGNALRSMAGRFFGKSAVHVIDTRGKRHHAVLWKIVIPNQGTFDGKEPPAAHDGEDADGPATKRQSLSDFFE